MNSTAAINEKPDSRGKQINTHLSRGQLFKGVLSNWSYLVINALIAFLMTPFVVRHLGDSTYGIWALVIQLTGYMGIVDVGLRSALVRFVSRFKALGDNHSLNRLMNNTLTLYVLIVPGCFLFATAIVAVGLPHMHLPEGMMRTAQITVFLAAACISCDFLFATTHASLAGLSRWELINGIWILVVSLRALLILLFLYKGFGLVTLAIIQLLTTLTGYSAETVTVHKLLPTLRLRLQFPHLNEIRPILEHGWYSFLISVANRLNYQIDTVVIALFLPVSEVTYYVIGLRLVEYLRDLLNSTTMVVAPLISSFEAVGETHRVAKTLIRSTKYSLFIGLLGGVGLFVIGPDFVGLWMGSRFIGPSGQVLMVLAVSVLASATQFASGQVLYGLSKHRLNVDWTIVESILNLGLSLALVRRYGIIGVAAGTAFASLIIRGWFYPHSLLKTLEISWREYCRDGVIPALLPSLSFLVGAAFYKRFHGIHSYPGLISAAVCGLIPFIACLWYFGLDRQERDLAQTKMKLLLSFAA